MLWPWTNAMCCLQTIPTRQVSCKFNATSTSKTDKFPTRNKNWTVRIYFSDALCFSSTCVSRCPPRSFPNQGGVCWACHESCETCAGAGQDSCLTCAPAHLHVVDLAVCLQVCPDGYYESKSNIESEPFFLKTKLVVEYRALSHLNFQMDVVMV